LENESFAKFIVRLRQQMQKYCFGSTDNNKLYYVFNAEASIFTIKKSILFFLAHNN